MASRLTYFCASFPKSMRSNFIFYDWVKVQGMPPVSQQRQIMAGYWTLWLLKVLKHTDEHPLSLYTISLMLDRCLELLRCHHQHFHHPHLFLGFGEVEGLKACLLSQHRQGLFQEARIEEHLVAHLGLGLHELASPHILVLSDQHHYQAACNSRSRITFFFAMEKYHFCRKNTACRREVSRLVYITCMGVVDSVCLPWDELAFSVHKHGTLRLVSNIKHSNKLARFKTVEVGTSIVPELESPGSPIGCLT